MNLIYFKSNSLQSNNIFRNDLINDINISHEAGILETRIEAEPLSGQLNWI